jgi:hypothetical protein
MTQLHLVPGPITEEFRASRVLVYGALADKAAGQSAATFSLLSMTDFDMVLLYLLEWEAAAPSPSSIGEVFIRELITLAKAEQKHASPQMTFGSVLSKLRLNPVTLHDTLQAWESYGIFTATLRALLTPPVDGQDQGIDSLRDAFGYFLAELNIVFELHGLREKGGCRIAPPSAELFSRYDTVLMYDASGSSLPRMLTVEAGFVSRVTGLLVSG